MQIALYLANILIKKMKKKKNNQFNEEQQLLFTEKLSCDQCVESTSKNFYL